MELPTEHLRAIADRQPDPLVFATVSGAHLYGFASADSDVDLRGCHVAPAAGLLSLDPPPLTRESHGDDGGLDLDLVTHDLGKFVALLLRPNGYVLEQLTSPLVVVTSDAHSEMLNAVPRLITRHHARHYLGFFETQHRLLKRDTPMRVKPLLYCYRVLLTGLHLMRSGEIEANLRHLDAAADLPGVDELIALKASGAEKEPLVGDVEGHDAQLARLVEELTQERDRSTFREKPDREVVHELDTLLVRERLATVHDRAV